MFTQGTLRYTALAAVNILVGTLAFLKDGVISPTTIEYVILGNFLVAGADVIKHIKSAVKPA